MKQLVIETIRPLYYFLTRREYRSYYKIFSKLSKARRYEEAEVSCLDFKMKVPDVVSFAYQFKEIFLEDAYRFDSTSERPVIYDCGANVGLSCLYFLSIFPNCKIKAFEADPKVFQFLKQNMEANAIGKDVELINAAIWISNEGIRFKQEGADGGSIALASENDIKIPSVRLRDLLMQEKIDFLKLDIEGAELEVLLDCRESLAKVPHVFFEYHALAGNPQRLDELLTLFSEMGFRYYIQSPSIQRQPFLFAREATPFDLQLNVFCYKP